MCTCIMKLMLRHVRVGGDVNVHVHLHHEVDATSRQGWGLGWAGVMLTFMCTCIMKLIDVASGFGVGWVG